MKVVLDLNVVMDTNVKFILSLSFAYFGLSLATNLPFPNKN